MVLVTMVVAMNVVDGSKREEIVERRSGGIEKNQNQKSKREFRPKKKKERKMVLFEVGIEN